MAEIEPKNLIVIGSAPCARDDLGALKKALGRYAYRYLAVGLDAADIYCGRLDYIATYHPAEIDQIRERRDACGGNLDYEIISHDPRPGVNIFIADWWKPSGSSSLLAVQAGLKLSFRRIILCGCPLTGKNATGGRYEEFHKGFEAVKDKISGPVRSMSGWTQELLGAPTDEWMRECNG
jgi:hypothetical protein